jgi:phosphohistidine phosphatase
MKSRFLTLIRHAKAKADAPSGRDYDRPLSHKGEHQAMAAGRWLQQQGFHFDALVCSPAARTMATTELVLNQLDKPAGLIRREPGIYEASRATLRDLLENLDDNLSDIAVVGHNPGLSELAEWLSAGSASGLNTGSVIRFTLPLANWQQLAEHRPPEGYHVVARYDDGGI